MITWSRNLVVCAMLGLVPALARPSAPAAQADEPTPQAAPPSPAPTEPPPAPPAQVPAAPPSQAQAPAAPAPAGQWVYTQQYGWLWLPHADAFTYVPPNGDGEPLEYVYYPSFGWVWVAAPWVWGIGPWPYFGIPGPRHFAWYVHGWWRSPSRWHFRPAPLHDRLAAHGIRPAPARGKRDGHTRRDGRDGRRR